ncbi:MAG TPA: endonuclease/exonuclease/phosphatase family protein [Acidimicrobiales bacterium]|nr:endonuclease/exonuclease/phosphatase family protein [Acidimicrobiales bacterium]
MPLTLLTWNVQGRNGLDVAAVAARIQAIGAGLVLLQEVTASQAARVASALSWPPAQWFRKHDPVLKAAEGLAVLGVEPMDAVHEHVLRPAPIWSSRRRIAVIAQLRLDGTVVAIANTHLTPHGDESARLAEGDRLVDLLDRTGVPARVLAGDLNAGPTSPLLGALRARGLRDAWDERNAHAPEPAGATNWTRGRREGRPPTQRIDHVLVSAALQVVDARTVDPTAPGFDAYARLSDHLPVIARLVPQRAHGQEGDGLDNNGPSV